MNKVILCGRLTRDPEVRYTQSAEPMAIARYTLAVDRKFKQDGEATADFINCIAFGKNGDFAEKYLKKGTKILVEGRWQSGNYTNKDGQKVYTNDCVVESHEFVESKAAKNSSEPIMGSGDDFMNIPDTAANDLPFK